MKVMAGISSECHPNIYRACVRLP